MKNHKYTAAFLLAASLLPASAFAKDKTGTKFTLLYKSQVGATELTAGDYKLQWEGTGDNVQVKVLQDGKVVATAPAKLVDNAKPVEKTQVTYRTAGDKVTVEEIDLSHSSQSLVLTESQSQLATN
ncbi:MAG: hypothetical protein WB421_08665 [Terriglobales bacterium]|jgi:hypothetical protein